MTNLFSQSKFTRLFTGLAGGCVTVFTVDDVQYRATGENGVRGLNVADVIIVRPDGSAHSDMVGEITSIVEVPLRALPREGTYHALAGGSSVVFHDGVLWFRASSEQMAVKGIDIPGTVTVTAEAVFSTTLGHIELRDCYPRPE